jgi:hypothetical protein
MKPSTDGEVPVSGCNSSEGSTAREDALRLAGSDHPYYGNYILDSIKRIPSRPIEQDTSPLVIAWLASILITIKIMRRIGRRK